MSSQSPSPHVSHRHFRIDTEHRVLEMMEQAIGHLRCASIKVELHDNAVLLTGNVASWSDKQIAQESIRGISGNWTIQNDLNVKTFV